MTIEEMQQLKPGDTIYYLSSDGERICKGYFARYDKIIQNDVCWAQWNGRENGKTYVSISQVFKNRFPCLVMQKLGMKP